MRKLSRFETPDFYLALSRVVHKKSRVSYSRIKIAGDSCSNFSETHADDLCIHSQK